MIMIKCFETATMPDDIYNTIKDILTFGEDGDRAAFWVNLDDETDLEAVRVHEWFLSNGAVNGEKVMIERGTWDN